MNRSFILFLLFSPALFSQDTIRIRNVKDFQEGKINILIAPSGRQTIISLLPKTENWEEATEELSPALGVSHVDPNLTDQQKQNIRLNECINTRFAGISRRKVKTTVIIVPSRTYSSLNKFLLTLPPDDDMKDVVNALSKPYEQRSIQEERFVTVKNLFLYAYAREKDNDYHLILSNADTTIFFNAEISGLPGNSAKSFQTLKAVRNAFDQFPGALKCGKYTTFFPPIRIASIKGSLFFDTDHPAGQVGPKGAKPKTAWEIHPVTSITF